MQESLHDAGIASSAGFGDRPEAASAAYQERRLDNYGALGGLVVAAGGIAAASVSMRGVYSEVMRLDGQWYHEAYPTPVPTSVVAETVVPALPLPLKSN